MTSFYLVLQLPCPLGTTFRESSFNITRGGGGEEDVEGGLRKFVYFKTNGRGAGSSKEIELLVRGTAKIISFFPSDFQSVFA